MASFEVGMIRSDKIYRLRSDNSTTVYHPVLERESDESSVNLIIRTFLVERRLFMNDIRMSIRIIYDGKYP